MSLRDPSDRAKTNWTGLDKYQQMMACAWAADYFRRRFREDAQFRKQVGTNVVGVSAGFRERRPKGKDEPVRTNQPVIRILVKKKWPRDWYAKNKSTWIPPLVELKVPVVFGGRGSKVKKVRLLALPTDVVEVEPAGEAHAVAEQALRVPGTGATELGTACCLVRQKRTPTSTQLYLLGCHHVIWRSNKMTSARRDPQSKPQVWTAPKTGERIGTPVPADDVYFSRDNPDSIDAALVKLADPSTPEGVGVPRLKRKNYWRKIPTDSIVDHQDFLGLIAFAGNKLPTLYPAGFPDENWATVKLRFVGDLERKPLDYGPDPRGRFTTVRISYVYEFAPTTPTVGGMSGSPVILDGVLVGMYIGGGSGKSFVLPAYEMFNDQQIPGFRLEVASDQIG